MKKGAHNFKKTNATPFKISYKPFKRSLNYLYVLLIK